MQRKNISILEHATGEWENVQASAQKFPAVVQWAERVKEFIAPENCLGEGKVLPYMILLLQASNAFVSSFIREMELHQFHAQAIARLGIDTVMQMAIIEADYECNSRIWWGYNGINATEEEKSKFDEDFYIIFCRNRFSRAFDNYLPEETRKWLQQRWKRASHAGSHASLLSSALSVKMSTDGILSTNYFDEPLTNDAFDVEFRMILDIHTFFVLAKVATKILELHNQELRYDSSHLEAVFREWREFASPQVSRWQDFTERLPSKGSMHDHDTFSF